MLGLAGMAHAQAPWLAAGLRPEDREVAGEIDERALDSRLREHERRAIDGVLLAETAEVELHARERQPHAVLTQLDALPTDETKQRRELRVRRHVPLVEAPRAAKHAGGRVESPVALPEAFAGECEELARLRVDRDPRAAGGGVDARDGAVRTIARELRLDARDLVDRARRRLAREPRVVRMDLHLVLRRHGAEGEAVQR